MRSDTLRQTATVLTFLVTLTVNVAANALPINGLRTAEISDRFTVFVIPAGYVFAIWGVIYLLLAAFTVFQALPAQREDRTLRALGWLPAQGSVLNAAWLLLFQYEAFALTVPVMVALLVTLIAIHLRLWDHRERLTGTRSWAVRIPFSVYLGWITVATIANVAQTGAALGFDGFGIEPRAIAAVVLLVGLAIAVRFVTRFRDVAYGLVIVWAYVGIVVKESASGIIPVVAGLGAAVIAALVLATIVRRQEPGGADGRDSVPTAA